LLQGEKIMPLVRVEIIKGKDAEYKKELFDAVHTALVNVY
jgi:phenylpyruvate tautomerase PptA (4-oxalocrotonate tautomerase family)